MIEKINAILDRANDDIERAVNLVMRSGDEDVMRYVIEIGLLTIKARARRIRRRELRRELQPRFKAGRTHGSVELLTTQSKKKLLSMTRELFGPLGWKIGNISLGDFTREGLIDQADAEGRSAWGHTLNQKFYLALAEPLQPHQRVRDYWSEEAAEKVRKEIYTPETAT